MAYEWVKTNRGERYMDTSPPAPKKGARFKCAVLVEPEPSGGASREPGVLRSQSLPLNWKYASQVDDVGRPVYTSFRQQKEDIAAAKSDGEPILFNESEDT